MIDRLTFAVPGDLDTPTGGYLYDKHIVTGLRDRGFTVDVLDLGDGFPVPTAETRKTAFDLLAGAVSRSDAIVVDGLALGVLPECAEMIAGKSLLVALVHHPLYLETGHDPETTERLRRSEHLALSFADFVITTSKLTADAVEADFSVPPLKIASVEPGFDRPSTLPPFREGPHVDILSVGAVVPRKGHAELIEALSGLTVLDWTLTIVGALDRDTDYARRVSDTIESHALSDRVVLKGAVTSDELDRLFASSDVFALASDHEGFGMAYAEAILNGLPVIGTTGGAVKTTVPDDAGILIDPGDIPALRKALSDVVSQTGFRRSLAEAARRHRSRYRTWDESADCFADLLKELK